jgi:hypothetical protein
MKIDVKAIGLGVLADLVVSLASGLGLAGAGIRTGDPQVYTWSLLLGLVGVAVGGYVTSVRARSTRTVNAVVFGVIEIVIGVIVTMFVEMPAWFNAVSMLLIIPASLVGAYLARLYVNN